MYCRQIENVQRPIFIYTFLFPTTPQKYLELLKDFTLQKNLDKNIDEYKIHKDLNLP
jgi:hypothetical protein